MLSVLLLILKIIGIILLVVLGLVLLVLFVPVFYSGKVHYSDDETYVITKAHWLLFPIRFLFLYENDEQTITLRIFGINVIRDKKEEEVEKKPYEPPVAEVDYEPFDEAAFKEDEYLVDLVEDESDFSEDELLDPKIKSIEYPDIDVPQMEDIDTGIKDHWWTRIRKRFKKEEVLEPVEEKTPAKEKVHSKFGVVKVKFLTTVKRSTKGVQKAINRVQIVINQIIEYINFINAKSTRRAFKKAKEATVRVLKHVFPRKISGRLEYGFEEPHLTGQSLGGIAIAMDMFNMDPDDFEVIPRFDTDMIDAKLEFRGRVFICVLAYHFVKLYLDRDIRKTIKFLNK